VFKGILIGELTVCKTHNLVHDAQRIAHAAFTLLGNYLQPRFFGVNRFFPANFL
jgi:hypothetical protein